MPKAMHDKLAAQASKQGMMGDKRAAYIYGTMNKMKKKPKKKK